MPQRMLLAAARPDRCSSGDAEFWREFCGALRRAGYDDVLSIEHEDQSMDPVEAVTESVELLRRVTAAQLV
jgi:sugar phosphate isomerase/epimerase